VSKTNRPMRTVLVTGATGFVGRAVCAKLLAESIDVRGPVRDSGCMEKLPVDVQTVPIGGIGPDTDWSEALMGVDTVIHLAARVHVMDDRSGDPLTAFRLVNVEGTERLARMAATQGVKRFVFVSSIKVNGEGTFLGKPFKADDSPTPVDPYGVSKMEAEQGLLQLARETGLEVVIIRPPLVYGPGVKANFAAMLKLLDKGVPLPFGAIHNQRSLVALDNLVDLIITCINHPQAANQVFLVSDNEDISTTELLNKAANAMGKRPILLPVPVSIMRLGAKFLGKKNVADRLFGSLQVDISKARNLLGWTPPINVDEGLRRTVLGLKKIE
jgi:nucleoside-diphosphate-sugar epimerase